MGDIQDLLNEFFDKEFLREKLRELEIHKEKEE